jgi:ribonuclease VapC
LIAVDASAFVAIVLGEPSAERLLATLTANVAVIGAPTLVEALILVEARQGLDATRDLELLVDGAIDEVVSFDAAHATVAASAWRRFGKGRHPAALNYGDCLAYAVAQLADAPLLFTGDDFAKTDIRSVAS